MAETNDSGDKRKYGRIGCLVALIILVLIVIAIVTGLINIPGNDGSVTG